MDSYINNLKEPYPNWFLEDMQEVIEKYSLDYRKHPLEKLSNDLRSKSQSLYEESIRLENDADLIDKIIIDGGYNSEWMKNHV